MSIYAFNDNLEKVVNVSGFAYFAQNVSANSEGVIVLPSAISNLLKPVNDFIITGLEQYDSVRGLWTDRLFANNKVYPYLEIENDTYKIYVYNPSSSTALALQVRGAALRVAQTGE